MKAIKIDGVRFKHDMSESALSDALSGIQAAQAATNSLVGNLIKSRAAKDAIAESHFRDQLFQLYEPRLACAIAANKKLLPHKRATLENCFVVASTLDPDKPLTGMSRHHPTYDQEASAQVDRSSFGLSAFQQIG